MQLDIAFFLRSMPLLEAGDGLATPPYYLSWADRLTIPRISAGQVEQYKYINYGNQSTLFHFVIHLFMERSMDTAYIWSAWSSERAGAQCSSFSLAPLHAGLTQNVWVTDSTAPSIIVVAREAGSGEVLRLLHGIAVQGESLQPGVIGAVLF